MADKTELLPLGGDGLPDDYKLSLSLYSQNFWNFHFIPVVDAIALNKNRIRFHRKRPYTTLVTSGQTNYSITQGYQWKGKPGSGTFPQTSGGVIVYTEERPGVNLLLYQYDSAETLLDTFGTANYQCIGIDETLISGTANLVLTVRKTSASYDQKLLFYPNGGALTEVVDADFPASTFIGTPSHMDGYCFIASTDGYVYNSDLNSMSAWTATSKIAAQATPDTLVGTSHFGQYILALGTRSIEFFYNAGLSSGSPLQRVPNGVIDYGVIHQKASIEFEDNFAFVGESSEGIGIFVLENGSKVPKKISVPYIDYLLNMFVGDNHNTPLRGGLVDSNFVSSSAGAHIQCVGVVSVYGQKMVVFHIGGKEYGYVFGPNKWVEVTTTSVGSRYFAVGSAQMAIANPNSTGTSTAIYTDATSSFNDYYTMNGEMGGGAQVPILRTPPLTFGSPNLKFLKKLEVVGTTIGSSNTITIGVTDAYTETSLSGASIAFGSTGRTILHRLGTGRRVKFELLFNGSGPCAIDGAMLTYEIASH